MEMGVRTRETRPSPGEALEWGWAWGAQGGEAETSQARSRGPGQRAPPSHSRAACPDCTPLWGDPRMRPRGKED